MGRPEHAAEAEALLRHALDAAAAQQARSLELRAAVNLVQLLRGSAGEEEARRRLLALVHGFTEGQDLPDLRDARRALEERRNEEGETRPAVPAS
jgi:hypothetical protein